MIYSGGCLPRSAGLHPVRLECTAAEPSARTPRAYGRENHSTWPSSELVVGKHTSARNIENPYLESSALKTSVCLKVLGFNSSWLLLPNHLLFPSWPAHTLSLLPEVRGYGVSPGPWRLSFAFLPMGEGFHSHDCLYRYLGEVARKPLETCFEFTLRFLSLCRIAGGPTVSNPGTRPC